MYVEYREDDVQDSVFEAVLQLAYKMFKVMFIALSGRCWFDCAVLSLDVGLFVLFCH